MGGEGQRARALSFRKTPLPFLIRKTLAMGVPREVGLTGMGRIQRKGVFDPRVVGCTESE